MELPSPKRRRTSPHASIPVNASNTDGSVISDDGNSYVFSRPSYMTPTKASLARFHPHLITQPSQSTTPRSKGRFLLNQRSSTLKGSLISPTKGSQSPHPMSVTRDPQYIEPSQARELVSTATHVLRSRRSNDSATGIIQDIGDHEPRASPPAEAAGEEGSNPEIVQDLEEDIAEISQEISQSGDLGVDVAVSAQSPRLKNRGIESKSNSSKSTDHNDKLDDELVTMSTPSRHRAAEDDEPKLPSTPRQLGIEPPGSKPTGILSISPSRKGKRRRTPSTRSSPLKPRNAAPVQHVYETEFEATLGPRSHLAVASREAASALGPLEHGLERGSDLSIIATYPTSKLPKQDPLYNIQNSVSLNLTVSDVVASKGSLGVTSRDVVLRSPGDVLTVEIRMFLKDSGKVASIAVIGITSWASELGKWLNAPIADRTQDAIVRAVGRFWDMAEIRAFCWSKCEGDLKHLLDATEHVSTEKASDTAETPSDGNIEQPETRSISEALPVKSLSRCVGLNSMRLRDSAVTLDITWTINFTPSGKATSRVSAHASFPPSWAEEDGDDLRRIDEAFKRLVQSGKPVHEAVRCIAEVMFPDSKV